jgi:hypothetical protein
MEAHAVDRDQLQRQSEQAEAAKTNQSAGKRPHCLSTP